MPCINQDLLSFYNLLELNLKRTLSLSYTAMYPPKTAEYYPTEYYATGLPATAPPPPPGFPAVVTNPIAMPATAVPPAPGFPTGAPNQFYAPGAAAFQVQSQGPVRWSTGLCDCTDDCGNCCVTCFCPCITFGRIAEIVDRGSTSCGASGALYALLEYVTCCHCIYSCFYRSKLRAQYSLEKSPCGDCLVHCCCEPCALCQEYRELKNHGFDMKIGWHANLERRAQGATLPPVMQGGMNR